MSCDAAALRACRSLVAASGLLLLELPQPLLAEGVDRAWTVSLPVDAATSHEYQTTCSDSSSDRLRLLIITASRDAGAPREVAVQNVSPNGALEAPVALTELASPEDPLVEAYRCLALGAEDLLIVGSTRAGTLIAVESSEGTWKPGLGLGAGGDEVEVYDLAKLDDRRFVAAGTDHLRGFIVTFDLATGSVRSQAWGDGAAPSIVLDVEPTASGFAACGIEGGAKKELFSATSNWFAASFDSSGVVLNEMRKAGRVCRLLASDQPGTVARVLYDAGEETLGPLRLLALGPSLEPVGEEQVLLERIAYYYDLPAAATASSFAVLDQPIAFERIQVFERSSGRRVGSARLGLPSAGALHLAAGEKQHFVISQARDATSGLGTIRVDAFGSP
jgi:hypothetical protein